MIILIIIVLNFAIIENSFSTENCPENQNIGLPTCRDKLKEIYKCEDSHLKYGTPVDEQLKKLVFENESLMKNQTNLKVQDKNYEKDSKVIKCTRKALEEELEVAHSGAKVELNKILSSNENEGPRLTRSLALISELEIAKNKTIRSDAPYSEREFNTRYSRYIRSVEECKHAYINKKRDKILARIRSNPTWLKTRKSIQDRYDSYINKLILSTDKSWQFDFSNMENSETYSKLLAFLQKTPLSKKSGKKLRGHLKTFKTKLKLETQASKTKKMYQSLSVTGFNAYLDPYKKEVYLSEESLFFMNNLSSKKIIEWTIAHEVSHIYTGFLEGYLPGASTKTTSDIDNSLNACLYGKLNYKNHTREDLADMLAIELVKDSYVNYDEDMAKNVFESFCALYRMKKNDSTGHSDNFERAYALLKGVPALSKALSCRVESLSSCKIKFQ